MMVRIGMFETPKELEIDMPDDADREAIKSELETALSGEPAVYWLTDRHGRSVGVRTDRVAYIDVAESSKGPRIGFGA